MKFQKRIFFRSWLNFLTLKVFKGFFEYFSFLEAFSSLFKSFKLDIKGCRLFSVKFPHKKKIYLDLNILLNQSLLYLF